MFNNQLRQDLKKLKQEIYVGSVMDGFKYSPFFQFPIPTYRKIGIAEILDQFKSRLSEQEKMTRMILSHLGTEYAKITEETKAGKQEKEVLRRAKKK